MLNNTNDPIDPKDNKEEINEEEILNEDIVDSEDMDIVIEFEEEDVDDFLSMSLDSENDIAEIEEIEEIGEKIDDIEEIIEDEDISFSKHKIQGKHSLKYDSIFKGKKEDPLTDDEFDNTATYYNENFEVDKGSIYWFESIDNENYVKEKRIKEKVYEVLANNTDLNFLNNRRKPSKSDFNNYYFLLKNNLKDENFSNVEIFNELAVYFSDNLFNIFKLLDNKWRKLIIDELQEHIGKYQTNPEVSYKNISIGTEVEFEWFDDAIKETQIITGVVNEIDDTIFIVDSYEKIYYLELTQISKILNNTKFKYNLNKLNNIDFL